LVSFWVPAAFWLGEVRAVARFRTLDRLLLGAVQVMRQVYARRHPALAPAIRPSRSGWPRKRPSWP
jgi:hypothetical protein